jgi:hypothetical protein
MLPRINKRIKYYTMPNSRAISKKDGLEMGKDEVMA